MSTKQIILTLKYAGLLLFTIIRIVWFSPWEKIADDGENLRLKKVFEKKNNVLMLCFCHQMRSVLAIQFHARTLLPAKYWFKFIHKRFCIQGQKNTMNSSYVKHTAMYLGITKWHIIALYPTHRVILQVHKLLLINFNL